MGVTRAELEAYEGRTIPDLVPDDLCLLFVGINPGLMSAATGLHFAFAGNRFYPALRLARILPEDVISAEQARPVLLSRGIGITNIVARASARADQLSKAELLEGRDRLEAFVDEHRPKVVAIAGIGSYRTAFGRKAARAGRQEESIGASTLWVVPNPSGLNAHATVDSLAADYREAAVAAGVV